MKVNGGKKVAKQRIVRKRLLADDDPQQERRFYIRLPQEYEHKGHVVDKVSCKAVSTYILRYVKSY